MARLYEQGDKYYFDIGEQVIELGENNMIAYEHRTVEYEMMDMVGVQDPTDEDYWTWYRYGAERTMGGEENFQHFLDVAERIGTYLLRDTPLVDHEARFYERFSFDNVEEHLDELE